MTEECHAVYLMVEIRKIIEQNGDSYSHDLYPILKFYCDWVLHTKKNKITPEIEMILNRIYHEHPTLLEDLLDGLPKRTAPKTFEFIKMGELKREINQFLDDFGIQKSLTENLEEWRTFSFLLANILVDQPIEPKDKSGKTIGNIETFRFSKVTERQISWYIKFTKESDKPIITFTETF